MAHIPFLPSLLPHISGGKEANIARINAAPPIAIDVLHLRDISAPGQRQLAGSRVAVIGPVRVICHAPGAEAAVGREALLVRAECDAASAAAARQGVDAVGERGGAAPGFPHAVGVFFPGPCAAGRKWGACRWRQGVLVVFGVPGLHVLVVHFPTTNQIVFDDPSHGPVFFVGFECEDGHAVASRAFAPPGYHLGRVVSVTPHSGLHEKRGVARGANVVVRGVERTVVTGRRGKDDVMAHVAIHVDGQIVIAIAGMGARKAGRRGRRGWRQGSGGYRWHGAEAERLR